MLSSCNCMYEEHIRCHTIAPIEQFYTTCYSNPSSCPCVYTTSIVYTIYLFCSCFLWYILLQYCLSHLVIPTCYAIKNSKIVALISTFSKSEVEIVRLIIVYPGLSSSFLQEALSLDQPHVSRVLKRLLSKGCIRRVRSDCTGKRYMYRYFIHPSNGIIKTYPFIDSEIDTLLASSTNRHGPFYRLLAAFFDLDNETLAVLLRFLQDLYSARVDNSLNLSLSVPNDLSFTSTSDKLCRRNRLSAYCFRYFSRFRVDI